MASVGDVMAGSARWGVDCIDALDFLRGLPDAAVDLVFTSPPYTDARTYGTATDRDAAAWAEWLRPIVVESCRVSRCLAFFNVSDTVSDCRYGGGPEMLFADLVRLDGLAAVRPYVWHKAHPHDDDAPNNGQPGSGGRHFHRNCWEPVYGFVRPDKLPPPWSDNTAFGTPPRWQTGGKPSMRQKNGDRRNGPTAGRMARLGMEFGQPQIANPGNVIRAIVGGGHLGHPLAHKGEAPMPLAVAERFVCWFCPPGGIVLDPFAGTGTTCHAAVMYGRRFVGCDNRCSQVSLIGRRMRTVTPSLIGA